MNKQQTWRLCLESEKCILIQFDHIIESHKEKDPDFFNDDPNYRDLMNEAIGLKSRCSNKLKVISRYLNSGQKAKFEQINALSLMHFDLEFGAIDMKIESGILDFPWSDIANKSPSVHFRTAYNYDLSRDQIFLLQDTLKRHLNYNLLGIKFANENFAVEITPYLLHPKEIKLDAVGLHSREHFEVLALFLSLIKSSVSHPTIRESGQPEGADPVVVFR